MPQCPSVPLAPCGNGVRSATPLTHWSPSLFKDTRMFQRHRVWPPLTFQRLAAFLGLLGAGVAEVGVEPAAEAVLLIPATFSVPDQHQLVGGHGAESARCSRAVLPAKHGLSCKTAQKKAWNGGDSRWTRSRRRNAMIIPEVAVADRTGKWRRKTLPASSSSAAAAAFHQSGKLRQPRCDWSVVAIVTPHPTRLYA